MFDLNWQYRIRSSSYGGYYADRGKKIKGGDLAPSGIGYTMPAFIEYSSSYYDTLAEAKKHIKREIISNENINADQIDLDTMVEYYEGGLLVDQIMSESVRRGRKR